MLLLKEQRDEQAKREQADRDFYAQQRKEDQDRETKRRQDDQKREQERQGNESWRFWTQLMLMGIIFPVVLLLLQLVYNFLTSKK